MRSKSEFIERTFPDERHQAKHPVAPSSSLAISHKPKAEFAGYQLANNKKVDPRTAHLAKQSGSTGGKQLSPTPTSR